MVSICADIELFAADMPPDRNACPVMSARYCSLRSEPATKKNGASRRRV